MPAYFTMQANTIEEAQPLLIWEDRGRSGANVADDSDVDEAEPGEDSRSDEQSDGKLDSACPCLRYVGLKHHGCANLGNRWEGPLHYSRSKRRNN